MKNIFQNISTHRWFVLLAPGLFLLAFFSSNLIIDRGVEAEKENKGKNIEAIFSNYRMSSDPHFLSLTISNLESIGAMKCVTLHLISPNLFDRPYFDSTFKTSCKNPGKLEDGNWFDQKYQAVSGEVWRLKFFNPHSASLKSFVVASRISVFAIVFAIALAFFGIIFYQERTAILRLKNQEKEARKDKAIAQTIQILAHDVRRPFSVLKAGLSMLKNIKNQQQMPLYVGKIESELNRSITSVNGMIEDILEANRTASIITRDLSLKTILWQVCTELAQVKDNRNVNTVFSFNHKRKLKGQESKLHRLFTNLLINALEAMAENETISVTTLEEDDDILIKIKNTGSSIEEKDLEFIFSSFFSKNKEHGTGLGLAIVKKIVDAHQGRISCRSDQQANFVEFSLHLPASESDVDEAGCYFPASLRAFSRETLEKMPHQHS